MKPKHVLALASIAVIVVIGLATVAGAQGPVITTIGSPAVYDPELRAANRTTIDVPAVWPGELRAQADAASFEAQVITLFNQERARNGLLPLVHNRFLSIAAQGHTDDMAANSFVGHQGSNGSSPWDRIPQAGFKCSLGGEDVAAGQVDAASVVQAWLNSPGHRAIINGAYRSVGVGWTYKTGTPWVNFWTADFGGTPGQACDGDDDSNPQPVATATRIIGPGPLPATPTIPPWLLWTPTPTRFVMPATATPIPQPQGNGWRVTLDCNSYGLCTGIISAK